MGVTRPIFGAVTYVWGLNIRGKFQGHSSRASYFCQVRACCHIGVSADAWGGRLPPAWPLRPKFLRRHRLHNTVYESVKFRLSDSFSFGDIKSSIWHLVQWHWRYLASYRSKSSRLRLGDRWRQIHFLTGNLAREVQISAVVVTETEDY